MTTVGQVYCTVFDRNYLYQGVALYKSLSRFSAGFKLYCLTLDDESSAALRTLKLPGLFVVALGDLDSGAVNEIRPKVNYSQFCWSMQPLVCEYVLNLGEPSVTYLEADSWFYSDPQPIFDQLKQASASLAPHFFSPQFSSASKGSGRYCTHFNYFKNSEDGRACLSFWREKNFEYRKEMPTSYPGQSGLDEMAVRFGGVVEIANRGAGVAPWNVQQYRVIRDEDLVLIDDIPVIFYHYHQLARYSDGTFWLGEYPFSRSVVDLLYIPYIKEVLEFEAMVRSKVPGFNFKRETAPPPKLLESVMKLNRVGVKAAFHKLVRKLKGESHIIDPRAWGGLR